MAIAYLVNIDLNNNQLLDFKVYNRTSDETGLSGEGQLIYRTDLNVLKYHTGANTWITVGTSTDSWILSGDSGTDQTINNDNTVNILGGTYITTVVSATDTLTINHDATSRTDTASAVSPVHGATFTVIDSVTTNTTGHVTAANLKTVTLPNDNDTSLPVKNSAGTLQFTTDEVLGLRFGAADAASVTFNPATQLVTYSAPNDTYTLPISAGTAVAGFSVADINLTAGGSGSGIKSVVTIAGKNTQIAITETAGNNGNVKIALTDDVTIANDLTVTNDTTINGVLTVTGAGTSAFTGQVTVPDGASSAAAVNLGQVQGLIAGVGMFQGGYNASTFPGVPIITGAANIALDQGDFYVVTVGGTFFTETVEPGDLIFANSDIAANSTPALTDFTVVIADENIAGAGTSDANTIKGVAGFNSVSFTASGSGWIQLVNRGVAGTVGSATAVSTITTDAQGIVTAASETTIAIPASQVTDFCAAVQTCVADNSDTVPIGDGTATSYLITHNYGTRDIAVQCVRTTTPWDTVMLDVERTSVNTITLTTTAALPLNGVNVYLQIIK